MNGLPLNQVLCGDNREVMKNLPGGSIDLAVTSPPYWGLRDYGEVESIWGGDPECEHKWGETLPKGGRTKRLEDGDPKQSKDGIAEGFAQADGGNFCSECGAWRGQLGLEPHPQMYIDHLVEICREIRRVLKPSGTFWLNLGDTYYGGPPEHQPKDAKGLKRKAYSQKICERCGKTFLGDHRRRFCSASCGGSLNRKRVGWLQPKQLLLIPSRVAIALQHDGWILRNAVCWWKPNHMPSSVKDRLTCAYEHVFLFVKNNETLYWVDRFTGQLTSSKPRQYYVHDESGERRFDRPKKGVDIDWFNEQGIAKFKYAWQGHDYYFDLDAIRKPHVYLKTDSKRKGFETDELNYDEKTDQFSKSRVGRSRSEDYHSKGKNPGDLWRIPTIPFPGAHFAVFPPALIEPIIKAGCPRWICSRCGKPRTRITERVDSDYDGKQHHFGKKSHGGMKSNIDKTGIGGKESPFYSAKTVSWSDCGCGEGWVGGVVLDPFAGSGTALRVARKLGRRFIGIDINPEYVEMSLRRVKSDTYTPPPEDVIKLTEVFKE